MCDYSLHLVVSRPAKVGDKLITTDFAKSITRGFAAVGESEVAVCLLPGTELAFEDDIQYDRAFSLFGKARVNHDALEFPDGLVVKVTRLVKGQTATVLQLPAAVQHQDRKSTPQMSTGAIEA